MNVKIPSLVFSYTSMGFFKEFIFTHFIQPFFSAVSKHLNDNGLLNTNA